MVIRKSDTVVPGEHVWADVCVIGGGPAGLTVAAGLLGSGLRVLVVESGSAEPPAGGESYESSTTTGLRYPLNRSRVRGLGGSANHWDVMTPAGGPRVRLRELDELDFEDRVGVRRPGWPFTRSTLDPYYRRARTVLALQPAYTDEDDCDLATASASGTAPPGGPKAAASGSVHRRLFSFAAASMFT